MTDENTDLEKRVSRDGFNRGLASPLVNTWLPRWYSVNDVAQAAQTLSNAERTFMLWAQISFVVLIIGIGLGRVAAHLVTVSDKRTLHFLQISGVVCCAIGFLLLLIAFIKYMNFMGSFTRGLFFVDAIETSGYSAGLILLSIMLLLVLFGLEFLPDGRLQVRF
jgi:uncharacterized membrane protein YidH (DUF202 family)